MELILRLLIVLIQAYCLLFALIGAHKLRRKFGLDLYFILVGGLVIYMWWVSRLGIDAVVIGETSIPLSTVAYFSTLFAALLLVYVSDGVRLARRLILAVVTLEGLFLLLGLFTYLLLNLPATLAQELPEAFMSLQWQETIVSAIALLADMFILIVVYQYIQNKLPKHSAMLKLWYSLSIALVIDSLIYITGTAFTSPDYWSLLFSQSIGKIVMAGFIAPPLSWYIQKEIAPDTDKRDTFDIFYDVDILTKSLHHTKKKYQALLDSIKDGAIVIDLKGFVVEANNAFVKITSHINPTKSDLHYTALFHPDDRPRVISDHSARMANRASTKHFAAKGIAKTGEILNFEVSVRSLFQEEKNTGFLFVLRDVTEELKNAQKAQKLNQALQLDQLKSEIYDTLARLIDNSLKLVPEEIADNSKDFSDIRESKESFTGILSGLDDSSSDTLEKTNLNASIKSALSVFKERFIKTEIELKTDFCDPAPIIHAKKHMLFQLFVLLIDYASYWAVKAEKPAKLDITSSYKIGAKLKRSLQITIKDFGSSKSEEQQLTYDPLISKAPFENVNLGIMVCHYIISMHDGSISFENEEGLAEIKITLPMGEVEGVTETLLV